MRFSFSPQPHKHVVIRPLTQIGLTPSNMERVYNERADKTTAEIKTAYETDYIRQDAWKYVFGQTTDMIKQFHLISSNHKTSYALFWFSESRDKNIQASCEHVLHACQYDTKPVTHTECGGVGGSISTSTPPAFMSNKDFSVFVIRRLQDERFSRRRHQGRSAQVQAEGGPAVQEQGSQSRTEGVSVTS